MDRRTFLAATALTPALGFLPKAAFAKETPKDGEWITLFNGKDFTGWTPMIRGSELGENYADTFRIEDGVIKVAYDKYDGDYRGRYGYLFYHEPQSHYILRCEYRFTGEQTQGGPDWAWRNSGLMVHCQDPKSMTKDQSTLVSIEMQLLGSDEKKKQTTGNLCTPGTNVVMNGKLHTPHCTNSKSDNFEGDQWVTAEIEVHGNEVIRHKINGKTVLEYSQPQLDENDAEARRLIASGSPKMLKSGYISLQSESHPVEFRNVQLKKLPVPQPEEPTESVGQIERSHPEAFMLVTMPDTQNYTTHPEWNHHFYQQTEWIAANAERLNIKYVVHEGDIVNNNRQNQWEIAQRAFKTLDGKVPYALAPGNHDYGENGSSNDRSTLLNEFFSAAEHAKWPTFRGVLHEGQLENSWHEFEHAGQKYLIFALEWGPRDEAVQWAAKIAAEHPEHRMILVTHAYMYFDETRYDWKAKGDKQAWNPHAYGNGKGPGGSNDGEELWQKLVSQHQGFALTLNGHVLDDGAARMTSQGEHGNTVHQLLANYQNKAEGGAGYMRLIEFLPDESIVVRSFSPSLNKIKIAKDQQFKLKPIA